MSTITVGLGNYTTTLPSGELPVTDFNNNPITPLVTANVTEAVPTNGWSSSLSFPFFGDDFSSVMYANPLALKADSSGLAMGHRDSPRFINGGPSDPANEGVKYEYTYAPDIKVGLSGLSAVDAKLDGFGDWTVDAVWEDGSSKLDATFGNGLPFVYFERQGTADAVLTFSKQNGSRVGEPNDPLTYTIDGVSGAYNGAGTNFTLPVDAGTGIANGPQMRVSYDFNGDGNFDRTETFAYIPTDPDVGWQNYTQAAGLYSERGSYQDFANGSIKVEVWNAIGEDDIMVATDTPAGDLLQSKIQVPFNNLAIAGTTGAVDTLYLRSGAIAGDTPGALSPQAGAITIADTTAAPDISVPGWNGPGQLWHQQDGVAGLTINGTDYGIFGPSGTTWEWTDDGLTSNLGGKDYFSLAVLPDNTLETLETFRQHAYSFVTDSRVDYEYDSATGMVQNIFTATTEMKETGDDLSSDPLMSLYRHQWLNSDAPLTDYTYESPRGEMKVLSGAQFTTEMQASGLLPSLPDMGTSQRGQIFQLVEDAYQDVLARPITFPGEDTYWSGKELARLSELVHISNQVGHTEARDYFLNAVKVELQDWFDSTDGTDKQFFYNQEWGTLQGYPASFHSETQINDHQFHYGYFVQAAATIAEYDPAWAAPNQWGGMVDLLISDVANSDRADGMFPYLRTFDPYSGNSWASGHGAFASGNNQESSSEALNFATGVARWGAATGQTDIQNLGLYLHTVESNAVQQYWFDVDNAVFPQDYLYNAVGLIWGDGADHRTFFSADPEMIHGINFLPVNGGSLYLGHDPAYVQKVYDEIVEFRGGEPVVWQDLIWQYLALADPDAAMAKLLANPSYRPEEGESRAHTLHWISSLQAVGQVETGVTADTPFYSVFNKDGALTYVAYNPGEADLNVTFSDGTLITVPGHSLGSGNGIDEPAFTLLSTSATTDPVPDPAPDPTPDPIPDPTPDPQPDPQPDPTPASDLRIVDGQVLFADALGEVIVPWADGIQSVGSPNNPLAFTLEGLSGQYNGAGASFNLALDAGSGVGNATEVRISYDFNGDGTFDRVETYNYFPSNNVADWETYDAGRGLISADGAFADFNGGGIKVEVWNAFGSSDVTLDAAQSSFVLPFAALSDGTAPSPTPEPTPDPVPDPTPDPVPDPTPNTGAPALVLNGAQATFTGSQNLAVIAAADGANSVGTPLNAHQLVLENLTGTYDPGQVASFALGIDAGSGVGNATQMRITYDFNGDGTQIRTETYGYIPSNDVPDWETYGSDRGLLTAEGDFTDLAGGSITVELWNAFGPSDVAFDLTDSWFNFPFPNLIDDTAAPDPAPVPDPTPDPDPTPVPDPVPDPTPDPVPSFGDTLYLNDDGSLAFDQNADGTATSVASAGGGQNFTDPVNGQSFRIDNISGTYRSGDTTDFNLSLDALNGVGNGTQARVSYDFNGDGVAERVETYALFATNDLPDWENYTAARGMVSASGNFEDFVGGSVEIEVWNVIGNDDVLIQTDPVDVDAEQATLTIPYDDIWS